MSREAASLHLERHGDNGPTLLLIHGFGACAFTWRRCVPALARTHQVLVLDLKGFGASPKPRDGRYSPHDHTDAVLSFIQEHDLSDLTLIGHSLGGGISLLTALRLADAGELDRIRGLALLSSAAFPQRLPPFITAARLPALGVAGLALLPIHWIVGLVLRAIVYDSSVVDREMIQGYSAPLSEPDGRYGMLETARDILPSDLSELVRRFGEVDLPVGLLWGDSDRVVPPWVGQKLLEALPHARLDILPRCGHLPQEEFPQETLAWLERFLHAHPTSA